jgi:hypothetical protein
MAAPALFVARIHPKTGLPDHGAAQTPFDDLAQAKTRAETLSNLAARAGRISHYGVWRLTSEFQAEVTFAQAQPQPQPIDPAGQMQVQA